MSVHQDLLHFLPANVGRLQKEEKNKMYMFVEQQMDELVSKGYR